jgi:ABC-2 type transport system permease protein
MRAWPTLFRLELSVVASRGRVAGLSCLGALAVLVAAVIGRRAGDPTGAWARFADAYGLSLLVPVVSLLFAGAALGDPVEDKTLVYLWLRPVRRALIASAAHAAALAAALPLVVVPLAVGAALAGGDRRMVVASALASAVGVVAYTGAFTLLGLLTRRHLAWGLAYVLIWEGFIARASDGAGRLAILSYTQAVLAELTGVPLRLATVSLPWGLAVPLAIGAGGLGLATWRLGRADVP